MRVAIYFTPHPDSPVAKAAAEWFRGDGYTVAGLSPKEHTDLLAGPRQYGFHGTIKPPFSLQEGYKLEDVERELAEFTQDQSPFWLPPLAVTEIGKFFCLKPIEHSKRLNLLAADVVQQFDHFRRPAEANELEGRRAAGLHSRQEELLLRWGYPYVLDEFRFHLTLTGKIENERTSEYVKRELENRFNPALQEPVWLDSLSLFVQHGKSAFSQYRHFSFGPDFS